MNVSSPMKEQTTATTEQWTLEACSSWLAGQTFSLKAKGSGNTVTIGRSSHCDIIFPGTHLSREHVELRVEDTHIYVKDKGSANGTFINETRVSEGVLKPGDRLRLDVYSFTVHGPEMDEHETFNELEAIDLNATKLRKVVPNTNSPNLRAVPTPLTDHQPKQWVTKPTSPGNRIEEPIKEPNNLVALYVTAGVLFAAVAGISAYLFLS